MAKEAAEAEATEAKAEKAEEAEKKFSADIKKLGDKIVGLSLKDAVELADYLGGRPPWSPWGLVARLRSTSSQNIAVADPRPASTASRMGRSQTDKAAAIAASTISSTLSK